MSLFEIKHKRTGDVLFSLETESLKLCVHIAVSQGTDLGGAYLGGASLREADLEGASLREASLREADLRGAYLREADLRGAYLGGAYLGGTDLRGAYLRGADLEGASLRKADLRGAYLKEADLRGADLRGAYLGEADLRGADLGGTKGIIALGSPNGWHAYAWLRDEILSIRVGCHEFRLDEARKYWAGKEHRREAMAALDYAEAIARIREWRLS